MRYTGPESLGLFGLWEDDDEILEKAKSKVGELRNLALKIEKAPMPDQIPITQAQDLINKTNAAFNKFVSDAQPAIESNVREAREVLQSAVREVRRSHASKVGQVQKAIISAQYEGKNTISSWRVPQNIANTLLNIVYGYESILIVTDAKPWFLKMPYMIDAFEAVAQSVDVIAAGVKGAAMIVSGTADFTISLLKWGSLAGIVYLLYRTSEESKKNAKQLRR